MQSYLLEVQRIRAVSRFLGFREGVTLGVKEGYEYNYEMGNGYGYGYGYGGEDGQGYGDGYGYGYEYGFGCMAMGQSKGDGWGIQLGHCQTNGDGYSVY